MEALINYYVTGGIKVLETGMILFLVLFLVWCAKLYFEPDPLDKAKPADKPTKESN